MAKRRESKAKSTAAATKPNDYVEKHLERALGRFDEQPAVDMEAYAAGLPGKRNTLLGRLQNINQAEQQLAQAKNQVAAEMNELVGEAKAVAAMLNKSVDQVLGIPPGARAQQG